MTTTTHSPTTIRVNGSAGIYRVAITQPCGHEYRSASTWNSEAAAMRHGRQLLACVCGVCRGA